MSTNSLESDPTLVATKIESDGIQLPSKTFKIMERNALMLQEEETMITSMLSSGTATMETIKLGGSTKGAKPGQSNHFKMELNSS
jgi:hypothetical protein